MMSSLGPIFAFGLNANARCPDLLRANGEGDTPRKSVLLDSAARHGVVDIPDLTSDTLNKLSDAAPRPCFQCGRYVPCLWAACPYWRTEISDVRASVHVADQVSDGAEPCRDAGRIT